MVSAYKEGRLVRASVQSLLRVGLDALYIFEGPAGEPLGDEVPDSDYPFDTRHGSGDAKMFRGTRVVMHTNRWRTDARKRDAMLQRAKEEHPGETWAVIVDGDEVLWNGEYLRDRIESVSNENSFYGRSIASVDNPPVVRIPLRLMERDGGLHAITARCFRIDLVRSIDISSSVITNVSGVQEGWGNFPELSTAYLEGMLTAIDRGHLVAWPPFPCEPVIVHRSHLRHPLRRGLRMSDQESRELDAAKKAAGLA